MILGLDPGEVLKEIPRIDLISFTFYFIFTFFMYKILTFFHFYCFIFSYKKYRPIILGLDPGEVLKEVPRIDFFPPDSYRPPPTSQFFNFLFTFYSIFIFYLLYIKNTDL